MDPEDRNSKVRCISSHCTRCRVGQPVRTRARRHIHRPLGEYHLRLLRWHSGGADPSLGIQQTFEYDKSQMKDTTNQRQAPPVLNRFLQLDPDKLRGGYYTPAVLASWIVDWSVREQDSLVLEPSCGDGKFISAAAERLVALGAPREALPKQIMGIEILESEAAKATDALETRFEQSFAETVHHGDFFEWWSTPGRGQFDAVVGNPPFIRYQTFPEPHRTIAMDIMRQLGLKPNKLTNIWVPFVAAATRCLKPGGRLGLVLPAELLQVSYASQLRTFLTENFNSLHVVTCNELFFDGAQQEVIVLLAEGALSEPVPTNDCAVDVSITPTRDALTAVPAMELVSASETKHVQHGTEKWIKYFLSQQQIDLLRDLRGSGTVLNLSESLSVDVGIVTGRNEFFVVSSKQVEEWDLAEFVLPLAARASHLNGAIFDEADWSRLLNAGDRVYLLQLGDIERAKLPEKVLEYVRSGEDAGYHLGYKCSIREPWYNVPSVWEPAAFLFRQIHDFPRIILNTKQAVCTDTIHRVRVLKGDARQLASACYTSLTAASAEIEGRSYGGGVLELEPTEAERLLLATVEPKGLDIVEVDQLIRQGKLIEVLDYNDREILGGQLGLSVADRKQLRSAWLTMRDRRSSRRKIGRLPQER